MSVPLYVNECLTMFLQMKKVEVEEMQSYRQTMRLPETEHVSKEEIEKNLEKKSYLKSERGCRNIRDKL